MPADPAMAAILVPLMVLMVGEMVLGLLVLARYRQEPSAPALSGYLLLNPIPVLLAAGFGFYQALGRDGQLASQVGGFLVALTLMAFAASFLIWFVILYVGGHISEIQTALVFAPAVALGLGYMFAGAAAGNDINNVASPIFFSSVVFYLLALMVGAFLLAGRVFTESRTEKLLQYRFVFRNFFLPMYIASLVAAWIIIADFNEPLRGTGVLGWLSYVSAWAGIVVFVAAPPLMLGFGLLRGRIYPGEATGGAQAGRASHAL